MTERNLVDQVGLTVWRRRFEDEYGILLTVAQFLNDRAWVVLDPEVVFPRWLLFRHYERRCAAHRQVAGATMQGFNSHVRRMIQSRRLPVTLTRKLDLTVVKGLRLLQPPASHISQPV